MSLTGGTKDVNPQWFNIKYQQKVLNAFEQHAIPVPTGRAYSRGKGARVMELLKAVCFYPTAIGDNSFIQFSLTTASRSSIPDPSAAETIWLWELTVAPAYMNVKDLQHWVDFTDGAGHGIIIATDYIYLQVDANNEDFLMDVNIRLLYRFKNVGLTEYIGLVLQQSTIDA